MCVHVSHSEFVETLLVRIRRSLLRKPTDSEKSTTTPSHRFKHDGPCIFMASTHLGSNRTCTALLLQKLTHGHLHIVFEGELQGQVSRRSEQSRALDFCSFYVITFKPAIYCSGASLDNSTTLHLQASPRLSPSSAFTVRPKLSRTNQMSWTHNIWNGASCPGNMDEDRSLYSGPLTGTSLCILIYVHNAHWGLTCSAQGQPLGCPCCFGHAALCIHTRSYEPMLQSLFCLPSYCWKAAH